MRSASASYHLLLERKVPCQRLDFAFLGLAPTTGQNRSYITVTCKLVRTCQATPQPRCETTAPPRRLHAPPHMGSPTCVSSITLQGHRPESVMYGDSAGMLYLVLADTTCQFPTRDMLYTEHTRDYVCLHAKHSDAVTVARHVEDVGLVSASEDSKIVIFDVQRCALCTRRVLNSSRFMAVCQFRHSAHRAILFHELVITASNTACTALASHLPARANERGRIATARLRERAGRAS